MSLSHALRRLTMLSGIMVLLVGVGPASAQSPQTLPPPAQENASGPDWLLLTGGQGGPASAYGYVGALVPLGGSRIGDGWIGKFWGDYTTYNFVSNGQRITATAPGAEVLIGYQGSLGEGGYYGLFAGPRYRSTTFDNNFASNVAGSRIGVKGEAIGQGELSEMVRLNGIASYTTTDDFHWLRGRLLVGPRDGVQVGPEVVFQGNPDFQGRQYGLAITNIGLTDSASLGLHGGYETSRGLVGTSTNTTGAYFGVDLLFEIGGE